MKWYTNECVDCGFSCLGRACPYYKVEHYACDECPFETNILYETPDNTLLCHDCAIEYVINHLNSFEIDTSVVDEDVTLEDLIDENLDKLLDKRKFD